MGRLSVEIFTFSLSLSLCLCLPSFLLLFRLPLMFWINFFLLSSLVEFSLCLCPRLAVAFHNAPLPTSPPPPTNQPCCVFYILLPVFWILFSPPPPHAPPSFPFQFQLRHSSCLLLCYMLALILHETDPLCISTLLPIPFTPFSSPSHPIPSHSLPVFLPTYLLPTHTTPTLTPTLPLFLCFVGNILSSFDVNRAVFSCVFVFFFFFF